ncbi:MAG: ROK family protein [Acidimicrobiia bacterium]|nr:ROK family protein [Acidimicrobiia bacterium]
MSEGLFGAIEAGGTKFRVAIARGRDVIADTTIPTRTPHETLTATIEFLRTWEDIRSVGIACFGPLDLDPASPSYGSITSTPKRLWEGTPVLAWVRDALGIPGAIDIDVGGAALGEWRWGAARGLDHFVYVTVGTGIGAGLFIDGAVHHGTGHPEMGHIAMERVAGDKYPGRCPFHGACLEGLASGPAIEERWGMSAGQLSDRPEVWELEATYLARALRTFTYVAAPQRVVLGGGVMQHGGLLDLVRMKLEEQLAGYVTSETLRGPLEEYVVAPAHGQDAGLIGAIALAMEAANA